MPGEHDEQLAVEVRGFADELHSLVQGVFPGPLAPFVAQVSEGPRTHVLLEQQPAEGLLLTVDRDPLLRLRAKFRCAWDHKGEYLAVRESAFGVYPEKSDEPLFRYDFLAESDGKVPGAHLNVHGHRDELVFALMNAGRKLRGKSRSSTMLKGQIPRLATFHFPLGGHRFRPSLEDVVEIAVREFGLDTKPRWETVVRAGRARWRDKQLRSAVRDDPEAAADTLRHLGYDVSPPSGDLPQRREERITAL